MNVVTTTRAAVNRHGGGVYSLYDTLNLLRDAGFTKVDWYAPVCDLLDDPAHALNADNCRRWAHAARESAEKLGMSFVQMHCLDQTHTRGDEYAETIDRLTDNFIYIAQILGIRNAAIHPIITAPDMRDFDSCIRENVRWFRKKAQVASSAGVRLAVENMLAKQYFDGRVEWRFCTDQYQHQALVEAIDCENIGYCFDVGHANYTGTNVYDAVTRMGNRLFAIHVHDNDTFSDQHLLPWQGTVDFEQLARGLADGGYEGDLTMEVLKAANRMPYNMARLSLGMIYQSAVYLANRVDYYKGQKEGKPNGMENR